MDRTNVEEQLAAHVGGASNVSFKAWKGAVLHVTVKDSGMIDAPALEAMEGVRDVQVTRNAIQLRIQGDPDREIRYMATDFSELTSQVVDLVGGKDNIENFTHCVTRLRFNVKNKDAVQVKKIEKLKGTVGCAWAGNQFQVIVGQEVPEVYEAICKASGMEMKDEVSADDGPKEKKSFKTLCSNALQHFIACCMPFVPVMMGTGMVRCLLTLLSMAGVLPAESSTYQFLYFVADTGFYFLPVFVAYFTAKHFGGTEVLGALMGAMLLHPTFVNAESAFSFFGITVPMVSYSSSVFPAFLIVFAMCYIEKFFKRFIPGALRTLLVPMLTVLVTAPLGFIVIGPLGNEIGNVVTAILEWMSGTAGWFAVMLLSAIFPLMVMTGMHYAVMPAMFQGFATGGDFLVCNANLVSNVSQGIASLAVAIKSKNPDIRSTGYSCAATALLGAITEPAMYGVTLRYKTPLIAAMIGNAAGGLIMGINQVYKPFAGGGGTFYGNLPTYITDDPGNFIWATVAVVVTVVVTFVLTFILYKDPVKEEA